MHYYKLTALCLTATLAAAPAADACSRLLYETGTGTYIVARSVDWNDATAKTSLWVFPPGQGPRRGKRLTP
jgi:penicillin V acylase-like amidase (Ntn superfamily)